MIKRYFNFLFFFCLTNRANKFSSILFAAGGFLLACFDLLTITFLAILTLYVIDDLEKFYVKADISNFISLETLNSNLILIIFLFFLIKSTYVFFLEKNKAKFISKCYENFQKTLFLNFFNSKYNLYKSYDKSFVTKQLIYTPERTFVALMEGTFALITEIFVFLLIISFLFFATNNEVLLGAFFAFICYFFVFLFIKRQIKKFSKNFNDSTTDLFQNVNDFFNGYKEIIIFDKINSFKGIYNKYLLNYTKNWTSLRFILNYSKNLNELLIILLVILMLLFGKNSEFIKSDIDFTLAAFLISIIRLYPNFTKIQNTLHLINATIPQSRELKDFFNNLSLNPRNKNLNKLDDITINNENIELKLENISFKYKDNIVLSDININFKNNKKYFIFGKSGAGKSTLLDIILGLIDDYNGKILLNNRPIDYEKTYNRGNVIGFIPQTKFLINDSIFNNVTLYEELNTENLHKVTKCLQQVDLGNLVNEKDITKYQIGADGNKLSGGQAQRILLARVLYFDPRIMIFDEPTSNLDEGTEKFFIKNLVQQAKDKIIIYVSHNLSYISEFDEVYCLKNNKLNKYEKNS